MKSTVQKWGNSLAVRIPRTFAEEAKLTEHASVEITIRDGRLSIELAEPVTSIHELVARITDENRHRETEWGPPAGHEIW